MCILKKESSCRQIIKFFNSYLKKQQAIRLNITMSQRKITMLQPIGIDQYSHFMIQYSVTWPISRNDRNWMTSTREDVRNAWGCK